MNTKKLRKRTGWNLFILGAFLTALTLVSCASVPEDMMVSTVAAEENKFVQEAAQQLAYLDGTHLSGNTDVAAAARLLNSLETALSDVNLPAAARAQLLAFRGRTNLILGDRKAARNDYDQAQGHHKGDVQAQILGLRLGLIQEAGSIVVSKTQQPLITLEKALENYRMENYREAAAQFDEAFISLDDSYRQAYGQLREHAWRLRDVSASTDQEYRELLKQDSITLAQMISLIQGQGDLLYKYTGSRKVDAGQALRQLKTQGLFYSINSWTDVNQLAKDTVLTRALAARFLWNLYNDRRGALSDAPKYAHQFVAMGSPIQDVPLNSPDFDAILGCIEREFLDLPDGMHFFPEMPMSRVEFNESIQKIK